MKKILFLVSLMMMFCSSLFAAPGSLRHVCVDARGLSEYNSLIKPFGYYDSFTIIADELMRNDVTCTSYDDIVKGFVPSKGGTEFKDFLEFRTDRYISAVHADKTDTMLTLFVKNSKDSKPSVIYTEKIKDVNSKDEYVNSLVALVSRYAKK